MTPLLLALSTDNLSLSGGRARGPLASKTCPEPRPGAAQQGPRFAPPSYEPMRFNPQTTSLLPATTTDYMAPLPSASSPLDGQALVARTTLTERTGLNSAVFEGVSLLVTILFLVCFLIWRKSREITSARAWAEDTQKRLFPGGQSGQNASDGIIKDLWNMSVEYGTIAIWLPFN